MQQTHPTEDTGDAARNIPDGPLDGGFPSFAPLHKLGVCFAALLAVLALLVEVVARPCRGFLFDPLPTAWHVLLVACVPAILLMGLGAVRGSARRNRPMRLALGFAAGVSGFYSLLFAPLYPFAAMAVVVGLGCVVFAPLASLGAALVLDAHLRRQREGGRGRRATFVAGMGAGALALVLVDAPATLTRYGSSLASSTEIERRASGVRLLRRFGDREQLLRACYGMTPSSLDLLSMVLEVQRGVSAATARETYYRVTGRSFDAVPAPNDAWWRGAEQAWGRGVDEAPGADEVLGRVHGLRLAQSRLDLRATPAESLAYLEWTLRFANTSDVAREARCTLRLPSGGVVSRLTLWVDGEPREAAFAGRSQVRAAYESVVRARRDPVLVEWSAQDQVLVRCFPVPPQGEMQIRVGVTAPFDWIDPARAALALPSFSERNFVVPHSLEHAIWLEGRGALSSPLFPAQLAADRSGASVSRLLGTADDAALGGPRAYLLLDGRPPATAWTPLDDGGHCVQTFAEELLPQPTRLAVVVDGSASLASHAAEIAAALRLVPAALPMVGFLAADELIELGRDHESISRRIESFDFHGGCDNAPGLVAALRCAAREPGTRILWIAGPQPMLLSGFLDLEQALERATGVEPILYVQAEAGPRELAQRIEQHTGLEHVARAGEPSEDLARLVSGWREGGLRVRPRRSRIPLGEGQRPSTEPASRHLARLWAADEIRRTLEEPQGLAHAVELATRYQLVSEVTGAVVLEDRAQYEAAGLQPVDPLSVPILPEPQTWALLGVGGVVVGWTAWRRRRRSLGCAT